MTLDFLAAVALSVAVGAGGCWFLRDDIRGLLARRPISPQRLETPPRIEPVGPSDPFCTCPSCGLLGNHAVEIRHQPGLRRIPSGPDGDDWIEIGTWASPSPGPYAHRTCWSCGYSWRTSVDEPGQVGER